jgi:hypothetical protein
VFACVPLLLNQELYVVFDSVSSGFLIFSLSYTIIITLVETWEELAVEKKRSNQVEF